jgi:hypothetical protein
MRVVTAVAKEQATRYGAGDTTVLVAADTKGWWTIEMLDGGGNSGHRRISVRGGADRRQATVRWR